ncbi:hypothetical protein PH210_18805 [Paenibacillus sp. BSR1-1]|uniref:hypothetical protein n=1 Tax=Paenibacillus sp. BSR1-1 TaxID=3020845 RepID=UPI0025AF76BE|nr:hypothetical protein [Paenibacillus sp. BSR1-1]MDN3018232.1 hypothetical protein [Paenibacillus sp. BSR1-1]
MVNLDPNKQFSFEFDEQGANEVSEQIFDSYNTGFIDQGTALADSDDFTSVEE